MTTCDGAPVTTIAPRSDLCWTLDAATELGNPCYSTRTEALDAITDNSLSPGVRPVLRPDSCWMAQCAGCGDWFCGEESGASHFPSADELVAALPADGWKDGSDGAMCPGCAADVSAA